MPEKEELETARRARRVMIDKMTMTRAVEDAPIGSPGFVAGLHLAPSDGDEVEVVGLATTRHRQGRIGQLEYENEGLRQALRGEGAPDED